MSVRKQASLIAIAIIVFIYAILALANIAPLNNQCEWKFPKALSCLLGARENLTGGLVGGAGALFAAWVAWLAVRQQIDLERQKRREAELDNLWRNVNFLKSDFERAIQKVHKLEKSIEFTEPLARRFDGIDPDDIENQIRIAHELVERRELKVPDVVNSKIQNCFSQIELRARFGLANDRDGRLDVRDTIQEMLQLHRLQEADLVSSREELVKLKDEIDRREEEYKALEARAIS
jgi:hypothetical protein